MATAHSARLALVLLAALLCAICPDGIAQTKLQPRDDARMLAACQGIIPRPEGGGAKRNARASDLLALRDFGSSAVAEFMAPGFAVTPNGNSLAVQVRRADPGSNTYCHAILLFDVRSLSVSPILIDEGGEFIRDNIPLYGLRDFPTGMATPLTPKWSFDGRWLAFLRRDQGVTRLFAWSRDDGKTQQVSKGDTDVADFDWEQGEATLIYGSDTPTQPEIDRLRAEAASGYRYDSRFWILSSTEPFGETERKRSSYRATLFRDDHDNPVVAEPLVALPVVQPSAGNRAWIATETSADGASRSRVHAIVDGHSIRCEAEECLASTVAWLIPASNDVVFLRREGFGGASTGIYRWRLGSIKPRRLAVTEDAFTGCQFTGRLFCGRESSQTPRDIIEIDINSGSMQRVADLNPEWRNIALSRTIRLRWTNRYGLEAVGDLVIPSGADPAQPRPLVIVQYDTRGFLRGGTGDEYPIQAIASAGFAVLSVSRPPDFKTAMARTGRAIASAKIMDSRLDRQSTHESLLKGIEAVSHVMAVDQSHIAITGLSDGASAATYALIHSDIFSLALLSTCCDDPQITLTSIGPRYEQAMKTRGYRLDWNNPRSGWLRVSLAMNANKVCARVVIQAADREARMALYSYGALKRAGVDVEMFIFPDEHHIKWQPAHRAAVYNRTVTELVSWASQLRPQCRRQG